MQICIYLPQVQIFSPNRSSINHNLVVNFANLVHFGPSTFHLSFWSFTTNLGNLLDFLYVYPLVFWIFFFFFLVFSFLDFL